ncbi:MAG: NAD(P)/FAD-dependent oxidoreductase [Balneolaceae bacterium]
MTIIIGAGLSGLLVAYRLKQAGKKVKIIEARSRIGGRIHTLLSQGYTPVEMGATWLWNTNKNLIRLLKELNLSVFEQYMNGPAYVQYFSNSPAQPVDIPPQEVSYRIVGGTTALIQKLANVLTEEELILDEAVHSIDHKSDVLHIQTNTSSYLAEQVVLALPPRLITGNIHFEPGLPEEIIEIAQNTHTWMEDSIKVALTYKEAFWRKRNLAGAVFSNSGPINEFYDQTNTEETTFALCGFMNSAYKTLTKAEREGKTREQMTQVFGQEAANYLSYEETVWANEIFTSPASSSALFPHQNNGNPVYQKALFNGKLFFCSAECSPQTPGYMDGAVYMAEDVVKRMNNF